MSLAGDTSSHPIQIGNHQLLRITGNKTPFSQKQDPRQTPTVWRGYPSTPTSPHAPPETSVRPSAARVSGRRRPGARKQRQVRLARDRPTGRRPRLSARAARPRGAPAPSARPCPSPCRRVLSHCEAALARGPRPRSPPGSAPGRHFRVHGPAALGPERAHGARLPALGARLLPPPAAFKWTRRLGPAHLHQRHGVHPTGAASAARRRHLLRLPGDRGRLGRLGQRPPGGRARRQGRGSGEPQAGRHLRKYQVPSWRCFSCPGFCSARPAASLSAGLSWSQTFSTAVPHSWGYVGFRRCARPLPSRRLRPEAHQAVQAWVDQSTGAVRRKV